MKKFFIFFVLLLAVFIPAIAQDIPAPPNNWGDVIVNFNTWFASFAGVVVITAFLTAFVGGLAKVTKNFVKQLIAWGLAIAILVITDLLNFGYAKDFPITLALVHGFAAGLASNGVFDIPLMKSILDAIDKWFRPKI